MIADILLLIYFISMLVFAIAAIRNHKRRAKEWLENRKKTMPHWQEKSNGA